VNQALTMNSSKLNTAAHLQQEMSPSRKEFEEVPVEVLTAPFKGELDPRIVALLEHSFDRRPWKLYIHEPYSHWVKGKACILGDAAHPMMPNQSQ
jgi:salicylate hydroxylase